MLNYVPGLTANQPYYKYAVLGSAPNRELVVEAGNQHPMYDYVVNSAGNNFGSWQTVIYESGISQMQFNYGPTVGDPRRVFPTYNGQASSLPFTINGFTWPGSWCYMYAYNYGSYAYMSGYRAKCGMKTTQNQNILIDWNGNGWDASKPFVYTHNDVRYGQYSYYNTTTYRKSDGTTFTSESDGGFFPDTARYLPQSSIRMTIAWDYDFSADKSYPGIAFASAADGVGNGTTTFTSSSGQFNASMVGQNLWIRNVGPVRINAVNSSTNITLAGPVASGSGYNWQVSTQGVGYVQPGQQLYPTVQITNQGRQMPSQLTIRYRITTLGASTYTMTYDSVITSANLPTAFNSQLIVFAQPSQQAIFRLGNSGNPVGSDQWNIYEDTVTIFGLSPTADQNPGDNQTTDEWICAPPHDIKAIGVTSFPPNNDVNLLGRTPVGVPAQISIRFKNIGSNTSPELNVPVTANIYDPRGNLVQRDTQWIATWPQGMDTNVRFADFTPLTNGIYTVVGIAIFGQDQLRKDDTTRSRFISAFEHDVAALSVFIPTVDQEMVYTNSWKPAAYFRSVGASPGEFADRTQARVEIRRCSDGQLVFRADSIIPELNADNAAVPFYFPSRQGAYDITKIPPGCYNVCAISKLQGDGDLSNDTTCSQFSIIDRLKGDIYVGVGQRFQTLHAAVDSLQYRGVGGNVRLLLTDARYTENGTYKVSNNKGALDFTSIRGLSDTSTLTITPKPGVQPTIVFTGSRPFCFYFGDNRMSPTETHPFGWAQNSNAKPHVIFEGFNPIGVAPPDQLVAEPQKRTMTIIDSSTAAGGIFSLEEGSSNIVLKDLRLIGNGNVRLPNVNIPANSTNSFSIYGVSHDSDAVIRMWNEHNDVLYAGFGGIGATATGVADTSAIHDIRIENCEIAGAKYGIYDHGYRDGFPLPAGPYKVWRNYNNVITRNTIGTSSNPIGYAGIQFNHENGLVISHNEIAYVNANYQPTTGYTNPYTVQLPVAFRNMAYGIVSPDLRVYLPATTGFWPGDTGNVTNVWIDANRIHNIRGTAARGVSISQSTVFPIANYIQGSVANGSWDTLPKVTGNRVTNNMIFDLQGSSSVLPIAFQVAGNNTVPSTSTAMLYASDRDSIFANSISTNNAAVNISVLNNKHVFLWDNIIQNTGTGAYTNYVLEVPRPYASAISSDYNLFDLRGSNYNFAQVTEYVTAGQNVSVTQTRVFRRLNDWRTYLGQDRHSIEGDPLFASDSLNLPSAVTRVLSPATANGYMLPTGSMQRDFFGNLRSVATNVPNIGASDIAGYQYNNDLAVLSINQPTGYSRLDDTATVTLENPMWLNATVKNLSSQAVFGRTVNAMIDVKGNGGTWTNIFNQTTAAMNWDVNESKNVAWRGPTLTSQQVANVLRVVITVPGDQNNANNTMTKYVRVLLKNQATVISYNSATAQGLANLNALTGALAKIGMQFDVIDRNAYGTNDIDYTPYWTVIWAGGNSAAGAVTNSPSNNNPGTSNLSFKETEELTRYLNQSQTYAKKSLIMAGQNIAKYLDANGGTNFVTDTAFAHNYLHVRYVGDYPSTPPYAGYIMGQNPAYWNSSDSLYSNSPDVVRPSMATPLVGPVVNGFAYSYVTHPLFAADSGAAVTYYDTLMNTVFFAFDWSDPVQKGADDGIRTAGVTRVLNGALQFIQSHAGTILPVEFATIDANHTTATTAQVKWTMADQSDIASFDVESNEAGVWSSVGSTSKHSSNDYAHSVSVEPAKSYTFRVVAVDRDGAKTYSNSVELGPLAAAGIELGQSYPNPTSGVAEVKFSLPTASMVTLRVLDVTGKVVKPVLANEPMNGSQVQTIDMSDMTSGSYVYELSVTDANGATVTKTNKLTLARQ